MHPLILIGSLVLDFPTVTGPTTPATCPGSKAVIFPAALPRLERCRACRVSAVGYAWPHEEEVRSHLRSTGRVTMRAMTGCGPQQRSTQRGNGAETSPQQQQKRRARNAHALPPHFRMLPDRPQRALGASRTTFSKSLSITQAILHTSVLCAHLSFEGDCQGIHILHYLLDNIIIHLFRVVSCLDEEFDNFESFADGFV